MRGQQHGKVCKENRVITSVKTVVSARDEYDTFIALAHEDALEFVVSNTTEAGIVCDANDKFEDCPPTTFPAKLTKFLYERYTFYKGASDKGLIMLPTELNDNNGKLLRGCVNKYVSLWKLEASFQSWLDQHCQFTDTLVDRIVVGYPEDSIDKIQAELGYEDALLDQAEPFSQWVIGDSTLQIACH